MGKIFKKQRKYTIEIIMVNTIQGNKIDEAEKWFKEAVVSDNLLTVYKKFQNGLKILSSLDSCDTEQNAKKSIQNLRISYNRDFIRQIDNVRESVDEISAFFTYSLLFGTMKKETDTNCKNNKDLKVVCEEFKSVWKPDDSLIESIIRELEKLKDNLN